MTMKFVTIIFVLLLSSCSKQDDLSMLAFERDTCWHEGGKFSYEFGVVKENTIGRWYGYITKCEVKGH